MILCKAYKDIDGLPLWMVGMDFSTAFPSMLAASSSSIHSTNHGLRLDLISVMVETSGCVVCVPKTAASTVHLVPTIRYLSRKGVIMMFSLVVVGASPIGGIGISQR
jgi:hypothetical protein